MCEGKIVESKEPREATRIMQSWSKLVKQLLWDKVMGARLRV